MKITAAWMVLTSCAAVLLAAGPAGAQNWPVTPTDIRVDPANGMWLEDSGSHPYLVGVSESSTFSNLWGDPGEEWEMDGNRRTPPVTHPTQVGFLWSDLLDAMASHGMTAVRERVVPPNLTSPGGWDHHYNPYPFPWIRTDANKDYVPGYLADEAAAVGSPERTNWDYLKSTATVDFSQPQADYFRYRVRRFCQEAKARGIYVILTLFPADPYFPYEPDNPDVKTYVDMLLEHTQDLGNVLYEVNWEGGNGDYFTWWAGYTKAALQDAGRPTNVVLVNHDEVNPRVDHSTSNSTIVGHHRGHHHHGTGEYGSSYSSGIMEGRQFGKPVIWTEDFDEDKTNAHTPEVADVVRHRTWYSFVAGVHHIWYDWSMRLGTYQDPIFFSAAESLVTFLSATDVPFWTMSPEDGLASGADNWCLANPGSHYVVYFSNGVGAGTTLSLVGGPFMARWFDPKRDTRGAFVGAELSAPSDGIFPIPPSSSPGDRLVLYVYPDAEPRVFESVKINFQTQTVNNQAGAIPVPADFLADTGQVFAEARGYGWNVDVSGETRDRDAVADQLLDTLNHMQWGTSDRVWECAVINGDYRVTVSVGDASYPGGIHRINAEGITVISGFSGTTGDLFRQGSATVTVSDGRLTLDPFGGTDTKINYVTIEPWTYVDAGEQADSAVPVDAASVDSAETLDAGEVTDAASSDLGSADLELTDLASRDHGAADGSAGDRAVADQPAPDLASQDGSGSDDSATSPSDAAAADSAVVDRAVPADIGALVDSAPAQDATASNMQNVGLTVGGCACAQKARAPQPLLWLGLVLAVAWRRGRGGLRCV